MLFDHVMKRTVALNVCLNEHSTSSHLMDGGRIHRLLHCETYCWFCPHLWYIWEMVVTLYSDGL